MEFEVQVLGKVGCFIIAWDGNRGSFFSEGGTFPTFSQNLTFDHSGK